MLMVWRQIRDALLRIASALEAMAYPEHMLTVNAIMPL